MAEVKWKMDPLPGTGKFWWGEATDEPAREDAHPTKTYHHPLVFAVAGAGTFRPVIGRGASHRRKRYGRRCECPVALLHTASRVSLVFPEFIQ